jgi:hypothetical protein
MKIFWVLLFLVTAAPIFTDESSSMETNSSSSQGILISITNDSGRPISGLKILYTGGSLSIPLLKENVTYQNYVNPSSESHIELEFDDGQKGIVKTSINTYFERDYAGSLSILISKDNKVTWKDNIVIRQKYK